MHKIKNVLIGVVALLCSLYGFAQQPDSLVQQQGATHQVTIFSGSLGLTNNGFSIIPSFSLNSPAVLVALSWKKNRFAIEPDIRLTFDGKKGAMLFWFRYDLLLKEKFSIRMGVHPAMNLQIREITENGIKSQITQMRRFIAWEFTPDYQITKDWRIGVYYLQGNGLQKDGPQTTHYLSLTTSVSNIKINRSIRLKLIPAIYYLNLDGYNGNYFTATAVVSHLKLPFVLQSDINETFSSNLPGNKNFLWNVSLRYSFRKRLLSTK